MSHPRMRKAPAATGGDGLRPRGPVPRASGDSVPCNVRPKEQMKRSTSKNKIPKTIRYDLENALVGLCDVWFEDIKPHLVRNNIKVHVNGGTGAASGDYQRLPLGAPNCSHLDPGAASDHRQRLVANCADCYSTLPTGSKAPCRKPPSLSPSRPPPPLPPPSSPTLLEKLNRNHRRNYDSKSNPRSRRKIRCSKPQTPQPNWRAPRLCHTNTVISPSFTPRTHMRRIRTAMLPQTPVRDDSFFKVIQPRRKVRMKHKSTQTESPDRTSRQVFTPLRTAQTHFGRCPATTTFFPPRYKSSDVNDRALCVADGSLFSKDIINTIGEQNDKRIKLLYKCPMNKEESNSVMNLILSIDEGPKEACGFKKKPWR